MSSREYIGQLSVVEDGSRNAREYIICDLAIAMLARFGVG
jgi:hypothetical protein